MTTPKRGLAQESIQYFTNKAKPKKNEPDFRAANRRANMASYMQAKEQIAKWANQYGIDPAKAGVPLLRYSDPDLIDFNPTIASRARRQGYLGSSDFGYSEEPASEEDEGEDEIIEKKEKTPREQTEALKTKRATIQKVIKELEDDAKTGALGGAQIEGVNKKKNKGWFERNIGEKVGKVWSEVADTPVGDVTGQALDYLSRPGQATVGLLTGLTHHSWAGVGEAETVEEAEKRLGTLSPEQKANVQDVRTKWEHTHKQGLWERTLRGFQGKEDYSFVDPQMADAFKQNEYKKLKGGEKGFALGSGILMDAFFDPTNVVGGGVVTKGIGGIKDVATGVRGAEEVVTGVKAAGHAAEASRDVRVTERILQAPKELEAVTQSTRAAAAAGKGFEFGGEAQHAKRLAELGEETRKARKIRGATDVGHKELVTAAKAEARNVTRIRTAVKTGKADIGELKAAEAIHADALKRVRDAEELRDLAKITPVGGRLKLLEKQATRAAKLAAKNPENAQLVKKANDSRKALEAARVAAIPENAELLIRVAEKAATGKAINLKDIAAVVEAPAKLQDQVIALAKASEEMPGKANVADELIGGAQKAGKGKKAVSTATKAGEEVSADLPSSRYMQAINEAADKAVATAVSEETLTEAAEIAAERGVKAHKRVQEILDENKALNRKMTPATIKSTIAQEGLRLADEDVVKEAALASMGRKVATIKSTGEKLVPSAQRAKLFNESLLEEVLPTLQTMERLLLEGSEKRFVMRFATKDLGEFAPIGKMLRAAYTPFEMVGKIPGAETLGKAFRMGSHFPGETNYIRQMAENSGTVAHKAWAKRIQDSFKGMSRSEAKQVAHAIEDGTVFPEPHLEAWRQQAIAMRDEIFANQTELGKYVPAQKAKDYVYHYYRSKNKKAIADFKKSRNTDIKMGQKGPTLETAAKKGLKPETDIDKILMMQHRDYVRDLQRINFRQEVMSRFGVLTDNPAFANGLGLQEVSKKKLNRMFQDKANATKGKYFLPPEVHDTFKAMDDLMTMGFNPEANEFLSGFDRVVRFYKTSATIGNPANWINNTVGDFFLNWMDGVRSPLWYTKSQAARTGRVKSLGIAGHSVKTETLLRDFRAKAPSGGFIGTEGTGPLSRFGTSGVRGVPARTGHFVQRKYEGREESVRFAHFLHATDDEARKLIRAGKGKTFDDVREAATELAAKRVSKWNIDYTELTPFERRLRKRYIPFYTFMRKATPLMLEGMITRPGKINQYNRAQRSIEQFLGVPPMEDDGTIWPDWTKEQGITRLTNEDEPLYIRDPSPLNVINRLTGGDSITSPISNVANMTSPLIRIPAELASRRSMYNQKPIDDWSSYWWNQLPPVSIASRAFGHPLSPQSPVGEASKESKKKGTSFLERLGVAGVPIGRNTEARQQAELHGQINKIDDVYKKVNAAIAPYKLRHQTGTKKGDYWILKDENDEIIARYRDFNHAVREVSSSLSA